jgi:hypothetical protein
VEKADGGDAPPCHSPTKLFEQRGHAGTWRLPF